MASLAANYTRAYYSTAQPHVGLSLDGRELLPLSGYRRATPRWSVDEAAASATGTFGPFLAPVTFDAVILLEAGEVVQEIPVEPAVALPAGAYWDHEVVVVLHG